VGVSRDGPNFFSTPYYLRNAWSYKLQIWQVCWQRLSDQRLLKIWEKRECGCIQGLSKFFPVHPIISPMGKATNFKCGRYIHSVYPTKRLLKIWEKRERWRIQGLPNFLEIPPIISGTPKAKNFKFGKYIQRLHANKRPLKILEYMKRGRIQGRPKFFRYPLLSEVRVELQTSNLAPIFTGFIPAKAF